MSDERVVWEGQGVEVTEDGKLRSVWSDMWPRDRRTRELAQALAESEAKRQRLDAALRTIARWDVSGIQRRPDPTEPGGTEPVTSERDYFRQLALNALTEGGK